MRQRSPYIVLALFLRPALPGPPAGIVMAQGQVDKQADPTKGSKNVDQVVPYPLEKVLEAAKLAVATCGCDIRKENENSFECTRDRRVGLFIGSGGENVTSFSRRKATRLRS